MDELIDADEKIQYVMSNNLVQIQNEIKQATNITTTNQLNQTQKLDKIVQLLEKMTSQPKKKFEKLENFLKKANSSVDPAQSNLAPSSTDQNSSSSPKTSTEQNSSSSPKTSTEQNSTSSKKSISKKVSKESIIVEKQVPAGPNPRKNDPRPRTYENFRTYFGELFEKLIPIEFKNSNIPAIKSNSLSSQAYDRLHSKSLNNNKNNSFITYFFLIIRTFASLAN